MWIILFALSVLVCLLNFSSGTYLSGWDTLHPEFNFPEYFKRVIFGVWQAHQGLGAVATQAHAAELPRLLILYPLSFILPDNFLRYFYIFATLVLGPLGVYFFIKQVIKLKDTFAFLGGVFYLLNLVTVQHFYVPLEMFATHYAFVPWLFLFAVRFIETKSFKFIVLFGIFSFFSAPMAHTATLWYAYFLTFIIFLGIYNLQNKRKFVLPSLKLILITILTNAFWLLPNLYFILNHAQVISSSKIHSLFTEEAFAQNASFGTLENFALFKNFLFNWGEYVGNNKFNPLLNEWIAHLNNPFVLLIGFSFFLIILLGVVAMIKNKIKFSIPLFAVAILSGFFLLNTNPPLGFVFDFLQKNIPNFSEAIRFPFTKFSLLFIFAASIYFAYGVYYLSKRLSIIKNVHIFLPMLALVAITYYMLPVFHGNLISPSMRVNIPSSYFALFEYFKDKPYERIAPFPIHSFWGWTYNEWNGAQGASSPASEADRRGRTTDIYQGAGFLWFGLKQPILDREFDRWQPNNEQYYREMSHAVYTKTPSLFSSVLNKFKISYLLIDKSVVAAGQDKRVLFVDEIKNLMRETGNISLDASFGEIEVYKINRGQNISSDVFVAENVPSVTPEFKASYEDFAFQKYGNYKTQSESSSIFYPFRSIIDNQGRLLGNAVVSQEGAELRLPESIKDKTIVYPNFQALENFFAVDLTLERTNSGIKINLTPKFPKTSTPLATETNLVPSEKNFLISVNQKDNFILNDPPRNTPLTLGTVLLNTKEENNISFYPDSEDLRIVPDFSSVSLSLDQCEEMENSQINIKPNFGITPNGNSFIISGKDTYVCMTLPLTSIASELETSEMLLGLSFDSTNPSTCIVELKSGNCQQYKLSSIASTKVSQTRNSLFFGIKQDEFKNLGIKFFLDASHGENKTSYSNVVFTLRRPSFTALVSENILNLSLEALDKTITDSINIPFSGDLRLSEDITKLPKTIGDCPANPGVISPPEKKIVRELLGGGFIRYSSLDGSFCDHFSYQSLSQDQGYIIVIKSRNVKGLPIRLCVTNQATGRCDIYAHLTSSKNFEDNVFLLPPMKGHGSGFDISFNNFAIKNIPSVNDVASINMIPFPYTWLSQIETVSNSKPSTQYLLPDDKVKRINSNLYVAEFEKTKANDVLILSQSYEKGWKAYEISNPNLLNLIFPFVGKSLDHVLVSNWANGWVLPKNDKKSVYALVFLPQYLEYIGFIFLAGTPFFLFKILKDENKRN